MTPTIHDRAMKEVIIPTVQGMASEGMPYRGFLYAGLMIDADGTTKVLEYNCRFGDPETQPILMRLKSSLVELCLAGTRGELDQVEIEWDSRTALGVVMAAGGYPEAYRKGDEITGIDNISNAKVFQAGTRVEEGKTLTNGGRVLCVTALGETVKEAQQQAYNAVTTIDWKDVYYRTDIGHRAIVREEA